MLISLIGESPKQWDRVLAQAEFAYNDSPNTSIGMSPFQIMYGMHPRGVYELCDLGQLEKRSANGEEFTTIISELQKKVKARLQHSNTSYKAIADCKRREKNYEVGYFVFTNLKRDRFPKEEYNKLKMKNIGPCRILRKFSANAYELEILTGVGISPIFNVADLYPYVAGDTGTFAEGEDLTEDLQWVR